MPLETRLRNGDGDDYSRVGAEMAELHANFGEPPHEAILSLAAVSRVATRRQPTGPGVKLAPQGLQSGFIALRRGSHPPPG